MTEPFDPLALPDVDDVPDVVASPEPTPHDDGDQSGQLPDESEVDE